MEYTLTNNIEEATHWLSLFDSDSPVRDSVIPHKTYELYKLKDDIGFKEYFILDENGNFSMIYLCHKGVYVREKES